MSDLPSPPSDAGPLGFVLHYGNALMAELLRRELPRDQVRLCVQWWAAMVSADFDELSVDQLTEEFRAQVEYVRTAGKRS